MKKLVSLLLTVMLLCCSIVPALAERATPVITVAEFQSAMNKLAKQYIDWDLTWIDEDGIAGGNMANNPIILYNEAGYVTMSMVSFTVEPGDDVETITDLFIIISALTAAVPAVRDGVDVTAAPDLVFSDLQAMLGTLSESSTSAFGTLYGSTAMVMLAENEDGSIDMSMMLLYSDPTAE